MKSTTARIALVLAVCGICLAAGFGIGRASRSEVPVAVQNEAARMEFQAAIDRDQTWRELSAMAGEDVQRIRGMKPLVKAGPFYIFLNDATGEFMIFRGRDLLAEEINDKDETTLSYYGKSGHASCEFAYERATGKYLRVAYTTNVDGAWFDPAKYYYEDTDGNGQFDSFLDRELKKSYELKGLAWTPIGGEKGG